MSCTLSPLAIHAPSGTTCVGYLSSNTFAEGEDVDEILSELHDRFCGCTHITGSIRINFPINSTHNLTDNDFNFLYYVEEISGVLSFQNIPTLPSLTVPNLRIIRGDDFVETGVGSGRLVFSVMDSKIEQLYMPQLREISQGDVLFSEVGPLCSYKTVNWNDILNSGSYIDEKIGCSNDGEKLSH